MLELYHTGVWTLKFLRNNFQHVQTLTVFKNPECVDIESFKNSRVCGEIERFKKLFGMWRLKVSEKELVWRDWTFFKRVVSRVWRDKKFRKNNLCVCVEILRTLKSCFPGRD